MKDISQIQEDLIPSINEMVKALQEIGKIFVYIADSVFTDEFKRKFMLEMKKDHHRKRYQRMVKRRTAGK